MVSYSVEIWINIHLNNVYIWIMEWDSFLSQFIFNFVSVLRNYCKFLQYSFKEKFNRVKRRYLKMYQKYICIKILSINSIFIYYQEVEKIMEF